MNENLSTRDKQAIQKVTRYSDEFIERLYQFDVRTSFIVFCQPGTNATTRFPVNSEAPLEVEAYLARLAAFAIKRLIRKHGPSGKFMIARHVKVAHHLAKVYQCDLVELLNEHNLTPLEGN